MTTQTQSVVSIGEGIAMLRPYLDYTEEICRAVPEDRMHWRPEGADGGYYFSLAESIQHIADTRIEFARQLAGDVSKDGLWNTGYVDSSSPWDFRAGSLSEILASLQTGRELLEPWLARPLEELTRPTEGTQRRFEQRLEQKREAGQDTAVLEAQGPALLGSVLTFLTAHEQGHRAVLQTQLRQLGIMVEKMA